ncbi:hypothetical protein N9N28_10420 [Rubripirellula amarantea]|nr:hypothetical protein [Rubripirellula amarantea]
MSMYRNRFFLAGVLLILLGIQFRMVDSFVLNESTTRMLARVTKSTPVADTSSMSNFMMSVHPKPMKRVTPPRWLGLAMIAVGAVMSCHALALPRQQRHD